LTTDPIRLTDLANPRFSAEITGLRAGMAAMAEDLDFAPDALRAQASSEVGLADFGSATYEAPLEALTGAIEDSDLLSPVGRLMLHAQLVQLLKNRLLLEDLVTRHPEIEDIEIERPIIICGLPRTGTTHLHNLMAADEALRSLPYWESLEPIAPPGQSTDVRFDEFMADDIAMVQRIYGLAGQPFTKAVSGAMRTYMADHPQGRHGRIDYRPEDVGLDRKELERRFGFYSERFLAS